MSRRNLPRQKGGRRVVKRRPLLTPRPPVPKKKAAPKARHLTTTMSISLPHATKAAAVKAAYAAEMRVSHWIARLIDQATGR